MQLLYTLVLNDSKDHLVMDGYDIKREGVPGSRMIYHIFNIEGTEEEIRAHMTKTIDELFAAAAAKRQENKDA